MKYGEEDIYHEGKVQINVVVFFVCLFDRLWMYQRSYANFSCAKIYFNWHNHTALTLFMYFAFKESLNLELPFWKFFLNKMSCAFIAFLNYNIVPDTYIWEITSYLQCANHFCIVVCFTVTDSNCYYLDLQCNPTVWHWWIRSQVCHHQQGVQVHSSDIWHQQQAYFFPAACVSRAEVPGQWWPSHPGNSSEPDPLHVWAFLHPHHQGPPPADSSSQQQWDWNIRGVCAAPSNAAWHSSEGHYGSETNIHYSWWQGRAVCDWILGLSIHNA